MKVMIQYSYHETNICLDMLTNFECDLGITLIF
jgi:hypothetical protein